MRNKWKNVGAGALVVAAAISTSAFARADCSKDTDCKGDRVCNAGVCVEGAPSTAPAAPPPVATAPAVIVMPAAPQSQMASRKTRNAGIGLFIAGLVMDAAGTALYVGGKTSSCKQETPFGYTSSSFIAMHGSSYPPCSTVWKVGIGFWIAGALATGTGIALWAVGGAQEPVPAPTATAKLRILPYADLGPSGGEGGMRVAF
jgi:hypothetical protein